jgi:hypothetical protein
MMHPSKLCMALAKTTCMQGWVGSCKQRCPRHKSRRPHLRDGTMQRCIAHFIVQQEAIGQCRTCTRLQVVVPA